MDSKNFNNFPMPSGSPRNIGDAPSRFMANDLSNTTRFENRFSFGNSPAKFDMGIGPGKRSGTGLEMSPVSDNFKDLMDTYDEIESQMREKKASSASSTNTSSFGGGNMGAAFNPNYGAFDSISPQNRGDIGSPQAPKSIESNSFQGITPEIAEQVEKSGYGPMAGLESSPQQQSPSAIEPPKNNLYNTANKTMEIDSKMSGEKTPPQPEPSGGGGGISTPMASPNARQMASSVRDRDDTLSMLAQAAHAYPHWMWGIG